MFPRSVPNPLPQINRHRLPANHDLPATYRLLDLDPEPPIAQGEHARDPQLALIEAVLFAADEPITLRKLAALTGIQGTAAARKLVRRLRDSYEAEGSAFQIEEVAGGLQLLTRPESHPWRA